MKIEKGDQKTVQITPYQALLKQMWDSTPNRNGERAPIYLNDKGEPIWINRRQRRAMASTRRRKNKHMKFDQSNQGMQVVK